MGALLSLAGIASDRTRAQGGLPDEPLAPTYRRFVLRADAPVGGFRQPEAVAVDPRDGTVFVLDHADHRIVVHGPTGDVRGVIGGKGTEPGHLLSPLDLDVAPDGTVVVADSGNLRIQRFDPRGRLLGIVGPGSLVDDPFWDHRPRGWPVAVAAGGDGTLYAAGDGTGTQRFAPDGTEIARWRGGDCPVDASPLARLLAGIGTDDQGAPSLRRVGVTAPMTSFSYVHSALDVAADGTVYEARFAWIEHRTADGKCLARLGGEGMAPGRFLGPGIMGLEVAPDGDLWATDPRNDRIQRLAPDGTPRGLIVVAGGDATDVALDASGDLFVAQLAPRGDPSGGRVVRMTDEGQVLEHWGRAPYAAPDVDAPRGIAVRADGSVIVAAGDRLQRFAPDGQFLGHAGWPGSGAGRFDGARGVAEVEPGRLFVAETGNHRIQAFTPDLRFERRWGGRGPAEGQFDGPADVAVGRPRSWYNTLYVADAGNDRITMHHYAGAWWGSVGDDPREPTVASPRGVATRGDLVVVADTGNDRVLRWDDLFDPPQIVGGAGTSVGQVAAPEDVAIDASGALYVADTGNDRIQRFDADGTPERAWGRRGEGPGELAGPTSLTVAADGSVLVADTGNRRIQRFDPLGALLAVWPTRRWDVGLDGSGAFAPSWVADVAGDADGRTWVVDPTDGALLRFGPDGILEGAIPVVGAQGEPLRAIEVATMTDQQAVVRASGSTVVVLDADGSVVTRWPPAAEAGAFVRAIAAGAAGRVDLLVSTEDGRGRVQRHDVDGRLLATWPVTISQPGGPLEFAGGPDGSVYVLDNYGRSIQPIGASGQLGRRWEVAEGSEALAVGPDGVVHVAQRTHAALARYDRDGSSLGRLAVDGACDGRPENALHDPEYPRHIPRRLAFGQDGRLLVAWASGCIEGYDLAPPSNAPWRLELFDNPYLAEAPVVAAELDAVDLDWGTAAPDRRVPPDGFSARLERRLMLAEPRRLTLDVAARGGLRLWVDDALAIDALDTAAVTRTVAIDLGPGEHRLLAEYRDAGPEASLRIVIPGEVALPTAVPTATAPASPSPSVSPTGLPTAPPTPPTGSRTATPVATASAPSPVPTSDAGGDRRVHLPWAGR